MDFIKPEDFMKIQLKKQQLQQRFRQKSRATTNVQESKINNVFESQKRANPFAKEFAQDEKRLREDNFMSVEDTIFELIHNVKSKATPNLEAPLHDNVIQKALSGYENELQLDEESRESVVKPLPVKIIPFDWSLKSKMRILTKTMLVPNNLQSSVEASGLTSFVRCIDVKNTTSGLDISDSAQFIQNLMYWQYPHLPWLNLVQRNSSSNNQYKMEQAESDELIKDWTESFKNLFQLLRARQCPYFYVLANHFSILFRAAGISGKVEMHALLTPTTKGFRQMLKDEDIEFTQPLKKNSRNSTAGNESIDDENKDPEDEEDDMDEMTFLESLGVKTSDIKFKQDVKARQKEIEDDNGDVSTALIEGVDCQALFNFLLNAKSTIPKVGRLAGVPPTLISPVGFLGGTLRKQTMKSSKLKQDGNDYFSIELMGAIMPHTVHTLTNLLSEIKEEFSLTMSNYLNTIAFTKTSRKLIEDLDSSQAFADHVFGRENLSDCGIPQEVLESMCRVDSDAVNILERLQFSKEQGGYTFL